jgi:cyanuric acid amidohydrolase
MAHPGDLSALAALFDAGKLDPAHVVAVIGKTEGNGGVNDFTRGYFTQSLSLLLAARTGRTPDAVMTSVPCVLSGGTEGVLSPHYTVFAIDPDAPDGNGSDRRLAIGVAMTAATAAGDNGRVAHARQVAAGVREAMLKAGIEDPRDIAFVQVKCPILTSARAHAAIAKGVSVVTTDPNRAMALARAAGAFGVALALGEIAEFEIRDENFLRDFNVYSRIASVSSGVEVTVNEIVVLGMSARWSGEFSIASHIMTDALDIAGIHGVLAPLGITPSPQVDAAARARIEAVLVKCEPDRRGHIRGERHTMLDDTDINAQRHIRGALGGLVAGVIGDTRLFVSGGAEHQGPDGGGLLAIVARV